uniref:Major facilitator superfamily (MFS) profile domain-containing protein n=1 Tax=Amphora coffeiformis TaxID=265554 RepID=A0A7S3L6Q3_9STRA
MLDRIGIRKASAVVFAASAVSYAILASANTMPLLFLSKIPTMLQHAFLVAQATAATSCAGNDVARSAALARMTTAYTVGASVGPALGGFLAGHGDMYLSAKLAVVGSLLSVVLSLLFLPDGTRDTASTSTANIMSLKSPTSFWEDLRRQANIAMRVSLLPLLTVKVIGGVSASIHSTALPLVLTQDLNFEPALLGLAMSCSMFAVAAFGAVAMAPLTTWWGPDGLAQVGLISRILLGSWLALLVTSTVTDMYGQHQIILVSVLRELSSHALATGLTTQTTGAVTPEEQGALLGLEHGLFSLARIGGPPLATMLLTRVGTFWAVAGACGGLDVCLVAVLVAARNQISSGQKSKLK